MANPAYLYKVTVVGCVHGDELLGKKVIDVLTARGKVEGLNLVFANHEAYKQGVRFVDQDLNRSFPGDADGNREQKIAAELLPILQQSEYVLDIHTTTSDVKLTPIIKDLSPGVNRILNLADAEEVVAMGEGGTANALIGQTASGVSLEFGLAYSQTDEALESVVSLIDTLLNDESRAALKRRLFHVSGKIGLEVKLPKDAKNFELIDELGIYPFLLHEKSYKDFQGFQSDRFDEVIV